MIRIRIQGRLNLTKLLTIKWIMMMMTMMTADYMDNCDYEADERIINMTMMTYNTNSLSKILLITDLMAVNYY